MNIRYLLILLLTLPLSAQVGINTTSPNAALDVNGDMIIRTVDNEIDESIFATSILVTSTDGLIKKISSKQVFESNLKTTIKGNFSGSSTNINISLGSNYAILPFDNLNFDTNNEFDTSTHTYTAKQDGIYEVYAQINSSGGLAISTNYGIQILKGTEVIAQENFANINISVLILDINITPPIRSVQTLVQLSEGETIQFRLFTNLLSVNLLRSKSDSYFTIKQIR
ncbi:hypothetical protein [uncultured Marixanthomonas sp.]|uniref:hypothetical protein n=1 Tax=uncultured Marixanthomonas sp. TaxID=757245 RepID=UPI0030DCEBBD